MWIYCFLHTHTHTFILNVWAMNDVPLHIQHNPYQIHSFPIKREREEKNSYKHALQLKRIYVQPFGRGLSARASYPPSSHFGVQWCRGMFVSMDPTWWRYTSHICFSKRAIKITFSSKRTTTTAQTHTHTTAFLTESKCRVFVVFVVGKKFRLCQHICSAYGDRNQGLTINQTKFLKYLQ